MAAISQSIFSNAFSWMKSFVFWFNFHWSLFLRVQLTISQHWFRLWLDDEEVTSHYLNQCWPDSLMLLCSTRGGWVNLTVGYLKLSSILSPLYYLVISVLWKQYNTMEQWATCSLRRKLRVVMMPGLSSLAVPNVAENRISLYLCHWYYYNIKMNLNIEMLSSHTGILLLKKCFITFIPGTLQ